MEHVYIVEVESGATCESGAMVFDSAWSTLEKAKEYCKKFERQRWPYDIFITPIDCGD